MKKLFLNYILPSLLLLSFFCLNAAAQDIKAEAKLQQYTIRIGDQTKLFLVVHQPLKEHVNFPKLADTLVSKVQIVSAGKLDTVFDQHDQKFIDVTQSYLITSFDAGTYALPAFAFGTAAGVLKTNELTLQVETVKVDTTKGVYDIKQPLIVTYTFVDWLRDNWYWIVVPIFLIAGIIGLVWYLKKRRKEKPVIAIVKPGLPAHIIAINKLNELKDKKLWQQDEVKLYYSELSDVLREYLEKRYVIKTHEKTTDEIFAGLKHIAIKEEDKSVLKQILVLADLVKFAKEKPIPAENELSMEQAFGFVKRTQQAEVKVNTEGGNADGRV